VLTLDDAFRPWLDRVLEETGPLALYDAHTHIGRHDPDGFRQTPEALVEGLEAADARGVVFPMHEPLGYAVANDAVLAAAAEYPDRLVPFCRLDPNDGDALREARRCLGAGARGIKLHPRAERFGMDSPAVRDIVALADERRLPILIHAGRGIPALGRLTVELAAAHPRATLILAHAAVSDLAWLWRMLPDHPNVLIDTAWWHPSDLVTLFALAPPASIVWASDSPYGRPVLSAAMSLRCALQAGLGPAQLRGIAGETLGRVLAGEAPRDLGPPPGPPAEPLDLLLERVVAHLGGAFNRMVGGGDPVEPLGLARLACAVGTDGPRADLFAAILELLDRYEAGAAERIPTSPFPPAMRFLVAAITVARTPDVPWPELAKAPAPTREQAEG
jgi:predicted TIM-barrel fold metal-dependent hydrolase